MKIFRKILFVVGVAVISGCASTPSNTVQVKSVNKSYVGGKYIVEEKEETATKSVQDTDVASILPPARVASYGSFFNSFAVGEKGTVAVTRYNRDDDTRKYLSSDIWLSKVRLTNSDVFFETPSFSSDSTYVYATSHKKNSADRTLWKMKVNGTGGRIKIGQNAPHRKYPQESLDGSKLLYQEQGYIWISSINGALPTQITKGIYPSWYGEDKIIYASREGSGKKFAIWTINTDGTQLTQHIFDNEYHLIDPAASPDGRYIAYVQQKGSDPKTRDVFVYDNIAANTRQITTLLTRDDMPKWSPDGSYLYFRSTRGGDWGIWRIDTSFLD